MIKGKRLTGNAHVRGDEVAQIGEHHPQVAAGIVLGVLAPQQCGETRAGMRPARHREVAQQRRGFGGDEVQRRSAARNPRASQQFQVELRLHGS